MWTDNLSRSDMVLIRKAIANNWPVSQETRVRVIAGMFNAMESGHARKTIAVGRTAVAMEAANIRSELARSDEKQRGR